MGFYGECSRTATRRRWSRYYSRSRPFAAWQGPCTLMLSMAVLHAVVGRLALIPKTDRAQPVPAGGNPAPMVDLRPLGIGGSIMRLISTAMCAQDGSKVGRVLSPRQLAVRNHRRHLHHSGNGAGDLHAWAGGGTVPVRRHPQDVHQERVRHRASDCHPTVLLEYWGSAGTI